MHASEWQMLVAFVFRSLRVCHNFGDVGEEGVVNHGHFIDDETGLSQDVFLSTFYDSFVSCRDRFWAVDANAHPEVNRTSPYVDRGHC